MHARWPMAALGLAALTAPLLTASTARAEDHSRRAVSVSILGGDHFPHPGLLTNDYRFPDDPTVVAQGGTITFHNKTDDSHIIALVSDADLPETVAQIHNCSVCNTVNGAFGLSGPNSNPKGAQLDNGVPGDDPANADADAPDLGAIKSAKGPLPPQSIFPILIADFDTASHGATVGDATIIDTADPNNGHGFPIQRTITVTAKPGSYHYFCTLHPWMQGTIRVVNGDHSDA